MSETGLHWFEPYVYSLLLCKTVKKVSITEEIFTQIYLPFKKDIVDRFNLSVFSYKD